MFSGRRLWLSGCLGGAALCALALGVAGCSRERAEPPSYDEAKAALDSVATAAGVSAAERMAACDLRIDWSASSLLLIPIEGAHMKPGDQILAVAFTAPNRPGMTAGRTVAEARWLFHGDDVTPQNGWANAIQQTKRPMDSAFYLNC